MHSNEGARPFGVIAGVLVATLALYGAFTFVSRNIVSADPNRHNVPADWEVRHPAPMEESRTPLNPNRHRVPPGWRVE